MHSTLEDWKNGWFGVQLSLKKEEIDPIIALLQMLKEEPDQHFHLSSDYRGSGGLGNLEVSIQSSDEPNNMVTLGKALAPGAEISDPSQSPDPKHPARGSP